MSDIFESDIENQNVNLSALEDNETTVVETDIIDIDYCRIGNKLHRCD